MEALAVVMVFAASTFAAWLVSRVALAGIFAAIGKPRTPKQ